MPEILYAPFHKVHEISYLWLIAFFPLVGATINGIFGKRLQDRFGKWPIHTIAIGAMTIAFVLACTAFFRLLGLPADERALLTDLFPMLDVGDFRVNFAFYMDPLSGVMTLVVTGIGTLIHIYSAGYMSTEPAYWRFFCYLNLFIFAMLLLVLGDSFILMFFGWEGVGLCSFLLIGFWYQDFDKATAGMKAFVVNRIGDFAFISGLFLLFWGLGGDWADGKYIRAHDEANPTLVQVVRIDPSSKAAAELAKEAPDAAVLTATTFEGKPQSVRVGSTVVFRELQQQLAVSTVDAETGKVARPFADKLVGKTVFGMPLVFVICFFFFIGACGKSAQIPLYVWLPDAMAGPTPVSALIHAATMVTAGVYMVARLNALFYLSPGAMTIVAMTGALTALFAATMGLFQYDIKKVLAYSTVSQLGFMFIGVGVGAWWVGIFHLVTHAFFKACLFLGSGSVIHGMHFLEHHGHDDHGDGHGDDQGDGHGDDHEDHPAPAHSELRDSPNPQDPQDMRNMGGLKEIMPLTRWTYLISCLAIAGFPVASGFYSKDEILWKAMSNNSTLIPGWLIWVIGFLAAGGTSFYMFRSYYMTFWGRKATDDIKKHCHESPLNMTGVLMVLAFFAVIALFVGLPHIVFHVDPLFMQWLAPVMVSGPFRAVESLAHATGLEWALIFASIGIATAGWWVARMYYKDLAASAAKLDQLKTAWAGVHTTLYNKYFVDEFYGRTFVRGFYGLANGLAWIDAHLVDWVVNAAGWTGRGCAWVGGFIDRIFVDGAVDGVATVVMAIGRSFRRIQTGHINNYAYGIAAGVLILVIISRVAL